MQKVDSTELGCKDAKLIKLVQDHVPWWALILIVMTFIFCLKCATSDLQQDTSDM